MVLLSALSTASEVIRSMRERRRGHDASEQESPDVARKYVRAALDELSDGLFALRTSRVADEEGAEDAAVELTRKLNELMILNRLLRLLHVIHQRLLSIYPEVEADLVEEARCVEGMCSIAASSVVSDDRTAAFVHRAEEFRSWARDALQ